MRFKRPISEDNIQVNNERPTPENRWDIDSSGSVSYFSVSKGLSLMKRRDLKRVMKASRVLSE